MVNLKMKSKTTYDKAVSSKRVNKVVYPYGLKITLSDKVLKKLGKQITDFSMNGDIEVTAKGKVTSIRSQIDEDYTDESVSIQLTDLELSGSGQDFGMKIKNIADKA